jgi:glyoxylase-like metal-dependent hydrolase (beta-lactamase superfamily II)
LTGYHFETLVCGPLGNNVYVVFSPDGKSAMAIDPALESAERVTQLIQARGASLATVLATHYHWDHVAEAGALAAAHGAAVLAHRLDAPLVSKPAHPMMFPDMEIPPATVTRELLEGDTVSVGETELQVLHTSGHTPGSICLYDAKQGRLFAGDTLFRGSFGRYDLPGGDPRLLRESLARLATLPKETRVYPGHGDETTIGAERWLSNPPI